MGVLDKQTASEEGFRYICSAVPQVASKMIKEKKENRVFIVDAEGKKYECEVRGVYPGFGAMNCFLPHSQGLARYDGPNPTLLVITVGDISHGTKAMFNAETGELVGPRNIQPEMASKLGDALLAFLATNEEGSEEVLDGETIRNYANRTEFIRSWVPSFFEDFGERGSSDVFLERLDQLFPLPPDFESFHVTVVGSDPRYWKKIEKTSDIMYALKQLWLHDRTTDLTNVYKTLGQIDPELESAIRIGFQRACSRKRVGESYR